MADEFDDFLHTALASPERDPDRQFVLRVQAQTRLDDHLRATRRSTLRALAIQIGGIAALAGGAFWITRSPSVSSFAVESPAILLAVLLAAFSLMVLLFSSYDPGSPFVKRASSI